MARDEIGQTGLIYNRNILGSMNRCKTVTKLTFQDGRTVTMYHEDPNNPNDL